MCPLNWKPAAVKKPIIPYLFYSYYEAQHLIE